MTLMDTSESALTPVAVVSAALARGASTARDLADASISVNTRLAYRSALAGFDGSGAPETDDGIASYLGQLFDAGRAASSAAMVVAAIRFRARLAGRTSPTGPAVDRALAGFRRKAQGRGRGQAPAMLADDLAAIAATARQPRQSRNGRGVESAAVADPPWPGRPRNRGAQLAWRIAPFRDWTGPGRRRGAGRFGPGRRAGNGQDLEDESGRERAQTCGWSRTDRPAPCVNWSSGRTARASA